MAAVDNVARAARNLITEHGPLAESIARARAKNATESDREEVANIWRDIASEVRRLQDHARR